MGRGDKKTAKGKRTIGSYGISRKKKKSSTFVASDETAKKEVKAEAKKPAVKKPVAKKAKVEASTEE